MLDDISDFARTGVTLIIVVILIGLPAMFITGAVSLEQGVITLQQGIEQVEQQEHVNSADTKPIVSTANKVKDDVKDIVVNGDYVENLTTIVNEAEKNSYVLPITLAIVLGFIILMYDRYKDAKKEDMERTERILKTPLNTFAEEELSALKSKYDE